MTSKIDLLKIKPTVKTEREFTVKLKSRNPPAVVKRTAPIQQDVVNNEPDKPILVERKARRTTIVDKRGESSINRDDFLKRFGVQKEIMKPIIENPIRDVDIEDNQSFPSPLPPSPPPPKTKGKKLGKKIRIKIKRNPVVEQDQNEDVEIPEAQPIQLDKADKVKPVKIKIRRKINIKGNLNIKKFNDINLPKKGKKMLIKASEYYLSNRQIFIDFISNLYTSYGEVDDDNKLTCEKLKNAKDSQEFQLLNHQKLVRDYINIHTPYRGILLFHGLGTGKTCSSIAITEGMKDDKQVVVMTPASLRRNYIEELKACGDPLIRRSNHWKFLIFDQEDINGFNRVDTDSGPPSKIRHYGTLMNLSSDFLINQGGVWLVNSKKTPNYEDISKEQRVSLENQLDAMIANKYTFINYNGIRKSHLDKLTNNGTVNPFSNKVVVVDEVHNLVSRIVNKLKRPDSLNMQLYHLLCSAENARLVFLSGTPLINYPNELGVLFNMLRGYIKTFTMTLDIKTRVKVSQETLKQMFLKDRNLGTMVDYIDYKPSTKTLIFSRNPFGFINSFTRTKDIKGLKIDEKGQIDDDNLLILIENVLNKNKVSVLKGSISVELDKSLPDSLDVFKKYFINESNGSVENPDLFKRFVMGLVSYYRSSSEELMPEYNPDRDLIVEKLEMNDYQFKIYEDARKKEREMERNRAKKKRMGKDDLYENAVSTYRIFSRLFCNFVFPTSIIRPLPGGSKDVVLDEDRIDAKTSEELMADEETAFSPDDEPELLKDESNLKMKDYDTRIKEALGELENKKMELFSKASLGQYSPKFLKMLENIEDDTNIGSHLIYSQFRTLEGIGIFKLVLEANGFTQFKIVKNDVGSIVLDIPSGDIDKPKFVLYTGTEDTETKEIYRNVFNGNWKQLPASLSQQLRELGDNNIFGDIVKLFMITSSGAEGISLMNCRHVHIMEPYWHPVRVRQVIGRIRRICSHSQLPRELQNIKVFIYLMTLTDKQKKSDESLELRLKDVSKLDRQAPLTTDEALFEISNIKEEISNQLETAMKEASIDCMVYLKQNSSEGLSCLSFGPTNDSSKLSRNKSVKEDEVDDVQRLNKTTVTMKAVEITLEGKKYAFVKREDTANMGADRPDLIGLVYDYTSFIKARENPSMHPRMIGELVKNDTGEGYVLNTI